MDKKKKNKLIKNTSYPLSVFYDAQRFNNSFDSNGQELDQSSTPSESAAGADSTCAAGFSEAYDYDDRWYYEEPEYQFQDTLDYLSAEMEDQIYYIQEYLDSRNIKYKTGKKEFEEDIYDLIATATIVYEFIQTPDEDDPFQEFDFKLSEFGYAEYDVDDIGQNKQSIKITLSANIRRDAAYYESMSDEQAIERRKKKLISESKQGSVKVSSQDFNLPNTENIDDVNRITIAQTVDDISDRIEIAYNKSLVSYAGKQPPYKQLQIAFDHIKNDRSIKNQIFSPNVQSQAIIDAATALRDRMSFLLETSKEFTIWKNGFWRKPDVENSDDYSTDVEDTQLDDLSLDTDEFNDLNDTANVGDDYE